MTLQIADPSVLAIPIQECGEPLIDLKDQSILQFGPPPECEATKNSYTKLRKTIYDKLCAAQNRLPEGWKFRIYEGFRSLEVQKILFNWVSEKIDRESPGLTPQARFQKITELVSPLEDLGGNPNIPVHNTGAAVDLEMLDENGNLVDFGMAVKDWIRVDPRLCYTDSDLISASVKGHRQTLLQAMQQEGFVNYPFEFWHFSYGDRYWAAALGKPVAIYGSVEKQSISSQEFSQKIRNTWPEIGASWLLHLPHTLEALSKKWRLDQIEPFKNLSYHFVAKALQNKDQSVVLKIGCDAELSLNEFRSLRHFSGKGSVRVLDHDPGYSALLLETANPGTSLKTLMKEPFTLTNYAAVVETLSKVPPSEENIFPHAHHWFESIELLKDPRIPEGWIEKAKALKKFLRESPEREYLCHGDLHFENVLSHGNRFVSIDPKGIIGEIAFEASAFDLFSPEELGNSETLSKIGLDRIQKLSDLLQLKPERLLAWIFLRILLSIQWSLEDRGDPGRMIRIGKLVFPLFENIN